MRDKMDRNRAGRPGFTLVEVMIVIAIILFLAAIVGVALFKQRDEAKSNLVQIQMKQLESGLKSFRNTYDRYPTDEEGLAVLWSQESLSPDVDQAKWHKLMEQPLPNDLWGHPWGYRQKSEHGDEDEFDLWSVGKDGEEGTEDDVKSWTDEADGSGTGGTEEPPPSGGR